MPAKKKKGKKGKAAPTEGTDTLAATSARGSIQDDKSAAGRGSVASSRNKPEGKQAKAARDKQEKAEKKRRDEEEKRRIAE